MGINMIIAFFTQSVSMSKESAILSTLRGSMLVIIAVTILSIIFKINGVWLSVPSAEIIALLYSVYLYKKFKRKYYGVNM